MSIDDSRSIDNYSISSLSTKNVLGSHSNHVKLGIVGMPNIGKSKLYNLFIKDDVYQHSPCDNYLFCTIDPYMATFIPDDSRFQYICEIYKPSIQTPSRITLLDTAGIVKGSFKENKGVGTSSLHGLNQMDLIIHMIRCFEDENVTHYDGMEGKFNPFWDVDTVNNELLLIDLNMIENALTEIEHILQRLIGGQYVRTQYDILLKAYKLIAGCDRAKRPKALKRNATFYKLPLPDQCTGVGIRFGNWDFTEKDFINTFQFITAKPVVYLLNMSSRDYLRGIGTDASNSMQVKMIQEMKSHLNTTGQDGEVMAISIPFEENYYKLSLEGKDILDEYRSANATHISALPHIIKKTYQQLCIIHFYTSNEKEVKCWSIRKGKSILESAEVINVLTARNFMRGDVVAYNDFHFYHGDRLKLMMEGKLKAETKKYTVNDGDIIEYFIHPTK